MLLRAMPGGPRRQWLTCDPHRSFGQLRDRTLWDRMGTTDLSRDIPHPLTTQAWGLLGRTNEVTVKEDFHRQ